MSSSRKWLVLFLYGIFLRCFVSGLQTWAMNLQVLLKDYWFAFSKTKTSSQSVIWLEIEEFINYCGYVTAFYSIIDWTRSSIPHIVKIAHNTLLDLQILSPWYPHVVDPTLIIVLDLEEEHDIAIIDFQYAMVPNPPQVATPSSVELIVVSISHHPKQMAMWHDKYHWCLHDNYFTTNP
jgi:hypothetical protein